MNEAATTLSRVPCGGEEVGNTDGIIGSTRSEVV